MTRMRFEKPNPPIGVSLALAIVYASMSAQAAVLVVDPQSTGKTEPNVYATISQAAEVAAAGDTVSVRPGTYRENVRLKHSGSPDAPIRFVAEKPGTVVITGADPLASMTRLAGDEPIYRIAWPHRFVIDHRDGKAIETHPEDAPIYGRAEQVIADDTQLLPCRDLSDLRDAWKDRARRLEAPVKNLGKFSGMFAVDTATHVLYLWLADGSDPDQHRIEASTRSQLFGVNEWESKEGVHDIEVSGFIFRYAANFPQRAAVVLHGKNNYLHNCLIERMSGTGVSVAGKMRQCLIRDNGHTGGGPEGDDFLVENCLWEGNSWKPINRNWEAGGSKVCDSRRGQFKNCVFRHNGGPGLWFDINCRDIDVTDCAFVENELSGLFIEISDGIRAEKNYVARNATGVIGQATDQAWSCGGIQLAESRNCVIKHNMCLGNRDGITLREIGPRSVKTRGRETIYHVENDTISDNIIAQSQKFAVGLWWDNIFFGPHPSHAGASSAPAYNPAEQKLTIDNDTFGKDAKFLYGVPWRAGAKKFGSLAEFTKATELEQNAKVSDRSISEQPSVDDRIKECAPFEIDSRP